MLPGGSGGDGLGGGGFGGGGLGGGFGGGGLGGFGGGGLGGGGEGGGSGGGLGGGAFTITKLMVDGIACSQAPGRVIDTTTGTTAPPGVAPTGGRYRKEEPLMYCPATAGTAGAPARVLSTLKFPAAAGRLTKRVCTAMEYDAQAPPCGMSCSVASRT